MTDNHIHSSRNEDTSQQSADSSEPRFVASAAVSHPTLDQSASVHPQECAIPPDSNTGGIDLFQKRQAASSDGAFIDWLSFTCKCTSFNEVSDDGIILKLSNQLSRILGYGITSKRPTGQNFYQDSYVLGNHWGFVCIGGQNDTLMVSINGAGCMAAKEGWENRMYEFLPTLHSSRITRADLARDFFDGEYTVDQALQDYDNGAFSLGAAPPDIEQRGNWRKPNGKGRTVYVGNRQSGKMARIYEKGKQLGRGFSELFPEWVRAEVEFKNQDREIPFKVLIHPGHYLAGSYPAFAFISGKQSGIKTQKTSVKVLYDALVNTAKHQFGPLINVMLEIEGTPDAVLERLIRDGMPKRLNKACMNYTHALPEIQSEPISEDKAFALTFHSVKPGRAK